MDTFRTCSANLSGGYLAGAHDPENMDSKDMACWTTWDECTCHHALVDHMKGSETDTSTYWTTDKIVVHEASEEKYPRDRKEVTT